MTLSKPGIPIVPPDGKPPRELTKSLPESVGPKPRVKAQKRKVDFLRASTANEPNRFAAEDFVNRRPKNLVIVEKSYALDATFNQ